MLHIFWAGFRLPAAIKQQILWRQGNVVTVPVSFLCRKSSLHNRNRQTFSLYTDPLSQPFQTFPRKDDTCPLIRILEDILGHLLKEIKGIKTLNFCCVWGPSPRWTGTVCCDWPQPFMRRWSHSWWYLSILFLISLSPFLSFSLYLSSLRVILGPRMPIDHFFQLWFF